jgi:valyl-tRNA synthetase
VVGKLGNEKFMSNAPEAVVAKEREKEAEIRARLAKTLESIERLQKLR